MNEDVPVENSTTSPDVETILRADGLKKCYTIGRKKIEVLHGVGMKVGQGEFLSVVGASGSGKSTLLHILGGLDRPDEGSLEVDGNNLTQMGS